jgi:hypothetical protein
MKQFDATIRRMIYLLLISGLFPIAPARATISKTQFVSNTSCSGSSNTCAVTVTSTGTGHFGVILWLTANSTSASSISGGGSWTIPASCKINVTFTSGCAYILSLSSGVTTITMTWSTSACGSPCSIFFYEESFTGSSVSLDNGSSGGLGTVNNTSSSSTPPGVALTLSGANTAIFQVILQGNGSATAISGSYNLDLGGAFQGSASALNTTNGTAPTWTFSASSTGIGSAIAISETSAPPSPTGLTAAGGNSLVTLNWNSSVGATSYNILRGLITGGPYSSIGNGIPVTNYGDVGVTNGTTYYYVVQAVNSNGTSGNSNEANATPLNVTGIGLGPSKPNWRRVTR